MRPFINPNSLQVNKNAFIEEWGATLPKYEYLQFQRIGYYNVDKDSTAECPVFNRTVGLRDTK
jgi:glutaminyl-tRNA synthetase